MPHINRIRVNNVKYNFGTQYYDDFVMRFSCKNTIYDLANGGGKSVLMLLLLQNLIPNCTLDDKQPIEKLFRTHGGSTTIHSMIEWRLSDVQVKDNYKYMLTGFCARKARESEAVQENTGENDENGKNSTAIEYFNYCIFYRKFNDNDIKNFPLVKDGERITFNGLKSYLKDLERNDMNLEVHLFERKGDYQRFITGYGLYESEWEIIRGINKTEGHVRTYFETNYKTTRKVVEDLLIEEIIEKSFRNKYSDNDAEDNLAKTLLEIKDKLMELSRKKDEINNYDRQTAIIEGFIERVASLKQLYSGIEQTFNDLKKIFNTLILEEKKNREQVSDAADKRLDILKNREDLSRKVDTAKVIVCMNQIEELTGIMETKISIFQDKMDELEKLNSEITLRECGNDYLEYISYKNEYDKLMAVIENAMKDSDVIISQLKELVAVKKYRNENAINKLEIEMQHEQEIALEEKNNLDKLKAENHDADNKIAVLSFKVQECSKNIETETRKMNEIKNSTTLLLPEDVFAAKKDNESSQQELQDNVLNFGKKKEFLEEEKYNLRCELQKKEFVLAGLSAEKERIKNQEKILADTDEKLSKLKEVYSENDLSLLEKKVRATYRNMVITVENEKTVLKDKESLYEKLQKNISVDTDKELADVMEYILRYHGDIAIQGNQYVAGLQEENRIKLISEIPFLPYSIVVNSKFDQLTMDSGLAKVIGRNRTVILVNKSMLDSDETYGDTERNVYFACQDNTVFRDDKIAINRERLKTEIEELKKSLLRKSENEDIVSEDLKFIEDIIEHNKLVTSTDSNNQIHIDMRESDESIKKLETEITVIQDKLKDIDNSLESLQNDIDKMKEEMQNQQKNLAKYNEIAGYLSKINEYISLKKISVRELETLQKEFNGSVKRQEAAANQSNLRNIRIENIHNKIESIKNEWNDKYLSYYDANINIENSPYLDYDEESFEKRIQGMYESVGNEHTELQDKKRLLSSYSNAMNKCTSHIRYMGIDISELESKYKNNELVKTKDENLTDIKRGISNAKSEAEKCKKEIEELKSKKDMLQGKATHQTSEIVEKYGCFEPDTIKRDEVDTFLNENGRILGKYEEALAEQNEILKNLEQDSMTIKILRRDIEKIMEKAGIKQNPDVGVFENQINLEQECKKISEYFDKFIDSKYKRNEEFERELSLLIDTLNKLGANQLALEIRNNVEMPSCEQETDALIKTLTETNEYISLEKNQILRGLSDMEAIKDNFLMQCIQNCINIRTEIDRLSKLSRITMDNESIAIINLKIPYVKEEFYKERMSEYIDSIASGTDAFEKPADKIKYIRNNLSWKKLFSVIVTDMNSIKLNLYKRERIVEQSRYLPYEEAVGSTGQSQGIYIQFLIAIINYISSINSKNADATRLRKVIFIDNPFGAAKDIYIWEPIFRLLKTNNVQLIVPARGATPAITGRFDVNYVLGQKLCGGRQQTVVVDYYSNTTENEMEYTALSYEQTALFNL